MLFTSSTNAQSILKEKLPTWNFISSWLLQPYPGANKKSADLYFFNIPSLLLLYLANSSQMWPSLLTSLLCGWQIPCHGVLWGWAPTLTLPLALQKAAEKGGSSKWLQWRNKQVYTQEKIRMINVILFIIIVLGPSKRTFKSSIRKWVGKAPIWQCKIFDNIFF